MANAISNDDDVIDSRDVIARIAELEDMIESEQEELAEGGREQTDDDGQAVEDIATCGECGLSWNDALITSMTPAPSGRCPFEAIHEEVAELKALREFAEEAEGYSEDWKYGATLIRDSYFERYAQDMAEDIGAINSDAAWPANCIDWKEAAEQLQQDYSSVSFDGVDYWVR